MSIYTTPDLSGLSQGISTAGSALAQALGQRNLLQQQQERQEAEQIRQQQLQNQQGKVLQTVLKDTQVNSHEDLVALQGKLLEGRLPMESVLAIGKQYAPFIKQQQKQEGITSYIDAVFNRGGKESELVESIKEEMFLPEFNQKEKTPIETISGETKVDSQTNKTSSPYTQDYVSDLLQLPNGNEISQEQISKLIAAPYEELRRLGESYQKKIDDVQNSKMKENAEIRKEQRQRISKFSEPYENISDLKNKVNKLKQVENIITKDAASFDDAVFRTVAQALLSSEGQEELAQIIKTPAQQKLYSLLRPFFGSKEIGGSNPSTREVLLTLETLPSQFKGKAANEYISKMMMSSAQNLLDEALIINELREDPNLTYSQFQRKLQERMDPIRAERQKELINLQDFQHALAQVGGRKPGYKNVFMLDPNGNIREVPAKDKKKLVEAGGVFLK